MSLEKNDKISWVEVEKLKPHPKNNNRHSSEQIERLQKIINYQGFRTPIVVSNFSGFIVAGHARLEAALGLGLKKVPVSYQDFTDEQQEYAHMTADNEIARWAELDWQELKMETKEWDLDADLLGIEKFNFDAEFEEEDKKETDQVFKITIECGSKDERDQVYETLLENGIMAKF